MVKEFGDKVETTFLENVSEGPDSERSIEQLARAGNKLIFTTSFGYMEPTLKVAKKYPNVHFEHATGYKRNKNMLHIKMLRSPRPHAKIISIDKRASLSVPGVHTVLTFEDAPDRLFSTARHEWDWMDPDDTKVLDNVVRFIGQKVAAVVADTEAAAEEGCRRLKVQYEILPAVIDPAAAIAPDAPVLHGDKTSEHRIANSARNIVAETHGEFGDVAAALAQAAVTYEGTFTTQRVQHEG